MKDGDTEESSLVPVPGATFADLPVNLIAANPHQPRQVYDEDDITELAASIKEVGLLQPIVVRRREHGDDGEADYELIMGEPDWRRFRLSSVMQLTRTYSGMLSWRTCIGSSSIRWRRLLLTNSCSRTSTARMRSSRNGSHALGRRSRIPCAS